MQRVIQYYHIIYILCSLHVSAIYNGYSTQRFPVCKYIHL
jgi:hypothetical protein